jgi:glycosyltransferase involved in cell wall biosynthesis
LLARFGPRIGLLYHYPPRAIRLPETYFRTRPPDAAPTISIVTPSFQHDRFLERTVLSVLEQEYPALEYFIQDGQSTDRSCEILHRYDDRVTGWTSERDTGQADAINRAFARTTGELMGWINSDDLMLPGALAYVARYFQAHPEVDVVYGNRLLIDENDGQIGAWVLPAHDNHALTFADYVPQETLFWRRRIWDASGGALDPAFSYALDWDLLLRFRDAGAQIVHLSRYLGAFRVYEEQKTLAQSALGLEEMARLRERIHGERLAVEAVLRKLRGYFLRHLVVHKWNRLLDRMPIARMEFRPSVGAGPIGADETATGLGDGQPNRVGFGSDPERPPPEARCASPNIARTVSDSLGMKDTPTEEDEVHQRHRSGPNQEDRQSRSAEQAGAFGGHDRGRRVLDTRDQHVPANLRGDGQSERFGAPPDEEALEREMRGDSEQESADQRDLKRNTEDARK